MNGNRLTVVICALLGVAVAGCPSTTPGPDGPYACAPGTEILVGCRDACGLGSCTGDPIIRICNGTVDAETCRGLAPGAPLLVAEQDDSSECGGASAFCPVVRVTCPSSGSIRVVHRAYGASTYTCEWAARAEGADAGPADGGTGDAGGEMPPTALPVDCRIPAMRTLPECDTIGSGDPIALLGSGILAGFWEASSNTYYVSGTHAIMRVDGATGARTIISGDVDDPRTGPRLVGSGPVWAPLELTTIRRRSDGQILAMALDGFYLVDPATGNRTFHRDFTGAPIENAVRAEGGFALGPADEIYVVLARRLSGSGVGVARLDPGGAGSVVTLSGAVMTTRNRGAGVGYDVAGYEDIEYFEGALYLLNFDDDNLMRVDPTSGDRVIVSDADRGGLPVGSDTDGYGHAIAGGSLILDTAEDIAFAHSTRIDLASGDRRFASPWFRDILETRHPYDAIYRLSGNAMHYDASRRIIHEALGFGIRLAEPESGNYNYVTWE
jgi:hypothetical protein